MKALSLWQPHASLMVLTNPATGRPFKPYETRHWPAPRWLIGRRVAIHAARNLTDLRAIEADLAESCESDEFLDALHALGFAHPRELPIGALLGSAVLAACHRTESLADPGPFGDFHPGRFAWEMADARPLLQPIPWRGLQGIFDVADEVMK